MKFRIFLKKSNKTSQRRKTHACLPKARENKKKEDIWFSARRFLADSGCNFANESAVTAKCGYAEGNLSLERYDYGPWCNPTPPSKGNCGNCAERFTVFCHLDRIQVD
jgi:hypothetical protein